MRRNRVYKRRNNFMKIILLLVKIDINKKVAFQIFFLIAQTINIETITFAPLKYLP